MNCKKCGSQLEPNAKFCMTCGEKVEELNNQEVAAQSPQPILPDAPEAPLPGTTNKVTEAPVVMPTTEVQPAAPVAPTPAGPVLPTPMAPVSPTPATPVSPTPAAPVSPTPAAPVAPTTVEPQTSVAPQAQVAPQTPATQPTANKNSNKIVIAIIVVLAIVSGVLLFVLLYGTNGLKNKDKTTTTTTEATTKSTTTTKKLVNEQEINGVLVTIPEGWTYTKVSIVGAILNETGGTQINIYPINDHNFEYYKQNINLVEESLKQSGGTNP